MKANAKDLGAKALAGCTGIMLAVALVAATGCSSTAQTSVSEQSDGSTDVQQSIQEAAGKMDLEYSSRDTDASYDESSATRIALSEAGASVSGDNATVSDSTVTIAAAGTYVITGSSSNGQIVIDAPDDAKVQIVLDGVALSNGSGPCIYASNADKVFVTLAENTANTLSDGSSWTLSGSEDEPDATIFCTCNLTVNGSGTLNVDATTHHGIHSTDDLVVTGGTLSVNAANDGLVGKDSVKIGGASVHVTAQDDGVKASNDADEDKGFVLISGGDVDIDAQDDGIKATRLIKTSGGTVTVDSQDDALHSDADLWLDGGTLTISAADDGVHAERSLWLAEGTLDITSSYEGIEGQDILVTGGSSNIAYSDDGINAAVASDETSSKNTQADASQTSGQTDSQQPGSQASGAQQPGGKGMQTGTGQMPDQQSETGGTITITGGTIDLVSTRQGDSLDSNGTIQIEGGTVTTSGAATGDSSVLDFETSGTISGGTFIGLGATSMETGFGSSSQASISATISGSAGDVVTIEDSSGTQIASYTAENPYVYLLASVPEMTDGETCAILVNGTQKSTATASTQQASAQGSPQGRQQPEGPGTAGAIRNGAARPSR